MDVNLLSRLLKELIIDNDRIPLPGMGYFHTEPTAATFSEDGKTIYPPSRRISFKGDERASGDIIARYYAKSTGIDEETAATELDAFLRQLKPTLKSKKSIEFPGLGRLRLTLEGNAYFVTDTTEGGLFAQAFGFGPVILKPVGKQPVTPDPVPEHVPGHTPEPESKPAPSPVPAPVAPIKSKGKVWFIILGIAAAIIIAAVILVELGRSGHLDSLIYSDEELELIRQMDD